MNTRETSVETVVKALRHCSMTETYEDCNGCAFVAYAPCLDVLMDVAADKLEELNDFTNSQVAHLLRRVKVLEVENELLKDALKMR